MPTTANKKPLTKTQLFAAVADETGHTKAEVAEVFEGFTTILRKQLGRNAVGSLNIPGLLKIQKVRKDARKAQKGVPNPFKPGETMDVAAKPAHSIIRVRPLKGLKDMV